MRQSSQHQARWIGVPQRRYAASKARILAWYGAFATLVITGLGPLAMKPPPRSLPALINRRGGPAARPTLPMR